MSYAPAYAKKIPLRSLTPELTFLLELDYYMDSLRAYANQVRGAKWMREEWALSGTRSHMGYLKGRIDGWAFGMFKTLLMRGTESDEPIDYAYESARREADFLSRDYWEAT